MSHDSLRDFLKQNLDEIPQAPIGERQSIWRAIESRKKFYWGWFAIPVAIAATAMGIFLSTKESVRGPKAPVESLVNSEESYLFEEWEELMQENDMDSEVISFFEKGK